MSNSYLVYRALFPPFYSARTNDNTGDVDLDRHFLTLRLPQIRLFGPMWSFGMRVREVDEVSQLPGMGRADTGAASSALRALYQMQDPVRLGKMKRFHTPVFLRAELDSFLAAVRSGAAPEVSGEDGYRALELAERIAAEIRAQAW